MSAVKYEPVSIVSVFGSGLNINVSIGLIKTFFDRTNLINAVIWIFSYDF